VLRKRKISPEDSKTETKKSPFLQLSERVVNGEKGKASAGKGGGVTLFLAGGSRGGELSGQEKNGREKFSPVSHPIGEVKGGLTD